MSRPKYAIAEADVVHASEYLRPLLLMRSLELRQNVSYKVAERDFHAAVVSPSKEERAKALNAWCEKYLKAPIWAKLKPADPQTPRTQNKLGHYVHLCFKESV